MQITDEMIPAVQAHLHSNAIQEIESELLAKALPVTYYGGIPADQFSKEAIVQILSEYVHSQKARYERMFS